MNADRLNPNPRTVSIDERELERLQAEVEGLRAYVGTLDATERRLLALLRRARQALRSFDELSDEELGNLLTALNAAVE